MTTMKIEIRYAMKRIKIWTVYRYKIARVHLRKNRKLFQLWIAGKLVRLAFKISSDLKREMGFRD